MTDLSTYEKIVKDLARSKSEVVYYNSGSEHATIVLENILLNARSEIKVVTGNFNKLVCADLGQRFILALKKFLLAKGKFKVIMNEYNPANTEKNSVLDILKQYAASEDYINNIEVKFTNEKVNIKDFDVHFMVGDGMMYRLEYDTSKFLAEFSFKGKDTCDLLVEKFDRLFEKSSPIKLSEIPY